MTKYTLSDDQVRGRYCDGTYLQTGHTTDGDDFDAWLARAKREALDRLAEEVRAEWDWEHRWVASAVRAFRDNHYPETED